MLSPIEENYRFGLDEVAKEHLIETTRWTKFLAIVGFIGLGLLLLLGIAYLFAPPQMRTVDGLQDQNLQLISTLSSIGFILLVLVIFGIYFYPVYALFKFSSCVKKGIRTENQELLNQGFRAQKNLYIYMGVVTIIVIALYVIIFLFALLGTAMATTG